MRSKRILLCLMIAGTLMVTGGGYSFAQQQSGSVQLENILPKPVVKDGTKDYTAIIQQALDKYDTVYFPEFLLKINKAGLTLHSNQVVRFKKGAMLQITPNANTNYEILRIHNVRNVKVYDANIVGDRYEHLDTKGEWGFGISIRCSSDVQIYNPIIKKCWGDGIYIGDLPNSEANNENVLVTGAQCDDNKRNGLSIITGRNIQVKNSTFTNSGLVGLDIEPNNSGNMLENIVIDNVVTRNSKLYGAQISLGLLNEDNKNYVKRLDKHNISISVNNHKDYGSPVSMFLIALKARNIASRSNKGIMDGSIQITNPEWHAQKVPFQSDNYEDIGPSVNIKLKSKDKDMVNRFKMKPASAAKIRVGSL